VPSLTLPAICDRASTIALYPDLCEALGAMPLAIDASRVERIGQAMLQVLASAARSEGGITVQSPSEPFLAALRLTGLEQIVIDGANG
jgi:anti-anti-sigma regulatory factor